MKSVIALFAGGFLAITAETAGAQDGAADLNCETGIEATRAEIASTAFIEASDETKWRAYAALADCALKLNRWHDALDGIDGLLSLDPDNSNALRLKLILGSFIKGKEAGAIDAAERLAEVAPGVMSEIDSRTFGDLLRKLSGVERRPMRLRLLRAIFKSDYNPPDPTTSLDGFRMSYIALLIDDRARSDAVEQIRLLDDPLEISHFLFDKRYDDLRRYPAMPTLETVAEKVSAEVEKARTLVAENPDRLSAITRYITALRTAGLFDDAERESARAVAAIAGKEAPSAFQDFDDQAPWVYNERAYALYDIGRNKEARAALADAAKLNEQGAPNVSQTINLASMLVREGLFEDAKSTIALLDEQYASLYGKMWAATVRVCANAFTDELAASGADLAFIRANEKDNDAAYAEAMLCIDDLDAAAANLIRRLEDLDRRSGALETMQRTKSARHALPIALELDRRRDAVEARADVHAALDKVGRILNLPFFPTYWGDY